MINEGKCVSPELRGFPCVLGTTAKKERGGGINETDQSQKEGHVLRGKANRYKGTSAEFNFWNSNCPGNPGTVKTPQRIEKREEDEAVLFVTRVFRMLPPVGCRRRPALGE